MFPAPAVAPQHRGRGNAKGHDVIKIVADKGNLNVQFDEVGGTWKAVRDSGPYFDSAVDIHIRDAIASYYNA